MPNFLIGGDTETSEGWMPSEFAPMLIRNPARGASEFIYRITDPELKQRRKIWKHLNHEVTTYDSTAEFAIGFDLMEKGIEDIVDIKKAPLADQMHYGQTPFGQGCLIARRLAEADASCFTEVILDGWGAPAPYFPKIRAQCAILDQALSALLDDLERLELLDETLVVLATPLGRSATMTNGTRGDNPAAFSCLLSGGGIQGGQIYGESGPRGDRAREPVTPQQLNRTIAWALGIDYQEKVFSPSKRPFTLGGKGDGLPLSEWFRNSEEKRAKRRLLF